jgi:type II secretory pathway component PulF
MQLLLSSGVLISDALNSLKDRFPDPRTRQVLRRVHADVVESRCALSGALSRFPESFPPEAVAVIEAGEEGGSALLAERFGDLADRVSFEEAHRRRIRRACAYPALAVCLSGGLCVLLFGVVFPRLNELLFSIGGRLPPLTRDLIAATTAIRRWGLPLAALPAAVLAAAAALRRHAAAGLRIDALLLGVPVFGSAYRESAVALVCKIYRSLYLANRPAPAILDTCARLVGNRAFRDGLRKARRRITADGSTLSAALAETGLFPPLACLAIEVGENTGRIAHALERVSAHYSSAARQRLETAIALINPSLVLLVVGGTGVLLLSFFQATYEIVYVAH